MMAHIETAYVMDEDDGTREMPLASLIEQLQALLDAVPKDMQHRAVVRIGSQGGGALLTVDGGPTT